MGSGDPGDVLHWVLQRYPAERYALVLWGHAYGLGFGRDHGDPMRLTELRLALEHFASQAAEEKGPSRKLDLLAPTPAP